MARHPLDKLADHTGAQHGHFSTAQARAADISKYAVHRLQGQALTERVHANVYRLTSAPVTWKGRLMAAVLAAGPGAVASHAWALKLHGIDRVRPPVTPQVTIAASRVRVVAGVEVHRSRELERCDIVTVDGIPATSGTRTAVDLASTGSETDVMAVVDDLICRRKSTREWMHRRACHLRPGRPGVGVIVRITHPDAEGEFWSYLERRFDRDVVARFGLPVPAYNVPVHDAHGRIGLADASWEPGSPVVTELEGLRFHSLTPARRKDARRYNRYATSGRIPLRFTYEDVMKTPELVARTILDALSRAANAAV